MGTFIRSSSPTHFKNQLDEGPSTLRNERFQVKGSFTSALNPKPYACRCRSFGKDGAEEWVSVFGV